MALSTSSVVLLRKFLDFPSLSLFIHYLVLYSSSCCLHCTSSTGDWSFEKWGPGDDGYIQGNSFFFLEASKASPLNVCNQRGQKLYVSPSLVCPKFVHAEIAGTPCCCDRRMVLLNSRVFPPLSLSSIV